MACKFWTWIGNLFQHIKVDAAKIAVAITEDLQTALKSGLLDGIATGIEKLFPNVQHVPTEIIAQLNKWVPKVLAAELAIIGLPDNPTEQDILDFENRVLDAFNIHDDKSKLYTTLSAQIYAILKARADDGTPYTFAEIVYDVEQAYQDLKKLQAEAAEVGEETA